MPNYTLTYSESSKGFPSFYSFYPDFMIGMNNYLYSFKGGQLYRHNTNLVRNNFYGVQGDSKISTVINQQPLDNKLFKTIGLESSHGWRADVTTDISQQQATVLAENFEEKEGQYFAYLRNVGVSDTSTTLTESDYKLRSVKGIGECSTVSGTPNATQVKFPICIGISSYVNINDYMFFALGSGGATFAGKITSITTSQATGLITVTIDTTSPAGAAPTAGQYIFAVKNSEAESSGVTGHYAEVTLSLPSSVTKASELFSIESDVIKSYP